MKKVDILGVDITASKEDEILEYITTVLEKKEEKAFIVTPNPEILVFAKKHSSLKNILNRSQVALADGIGVVWAAKVLGKDLKSRISGVDFMEKVCQDMSKKTAIVGFLGGRGNVAVKTAECLAARYPGLRVGFAGEEWKVKSKIKNQKSKVQIKSQKFEDEVTLEEANDQRPKTIDILFVAFGYPKQEEWIYENLPKIPVKVAMGVGGAFDYISGNVSRAPKIVQTLGFEWLFRLIVEPWRWKRQLALIEFGWLVLKEVFESRLLDSFKSFYERRTK